MFESRIEKSYLLIEFKISPMKSRRSFLGKTALLAGAAIVGNPLKLNSKAFETPAPLPSLKGRKVVFTFGGWDGHEPTKFKDYMVPWLESEGAIVTASDNLDIYTDKAVMAETDLVVQIVTMDKITGEQERGLLEAVRNGTGMTGWHGGMGDSFRNNTEYQFMVGGQWVAHPGGVIDYSVQITDQSDAVTAGLTDFNISSEQYYMHVDPNVKVLATTTFTGEHSSWIEGCVMPVTWKKMYGKGRIFYTSVGHNLSHVLLSPNGMTMIKRGIQWASDSKYGIAENWVRPVYKNQ